MGGNVEKIKERLDISDVIGGYIKIEKSGKNFKAKCPFHNEKTPSFLISADRQSYYCFGCGAKGDIFTFVQEMEGIDFREALKSLAERAGVELKYDRDSSSGDKEEIYAILDTATKFFEKELQTSSDAKAYLLSRGISEDTIGQFRLGYIPNEWRLLRSHLKEHGFSDVLMQRAGLIKRSEDHKEREPYDTFRGRVIFPISDARGEVIAFSGRALGQDIEPKYLNSPDTLLFTKSEVLYGFDKAKEDIRKKDYTVLVEGQMDLVLSHQAGVKNTVASSGTAFTQTHLERLMKLSQRIILAFDGDVAGSKAAEKSTALALALGMEVKIARLPEGKDPADLVRESPEMWKDILRASKHAIEVFLEDILMAEPDGRKAGKIIEKKILPLLLLIQSAIERSHFTSLIAKKTGIKEEVILEDMKRIKAPALVESGTDQSGVVRVSEPAQPIRSRIEERLAEIELWQKEFGGSDEQKTLKKEESMLRDRLTQIMLEEERSELQTKLFRGEGDEDMLKRFEVLSRKIDEEKRRML